MTRAVVSKPFGQGRLWRLGLGATLALMAAGCGEPVLPEQAPGPVAMGGLSPTPASPDVEVVATASLGEQELWSRLQQATDQTYAVMFRHAIAPGTGDPARFVLGDCSTQRNLSDEGRQQARRIGQAFRDRNILVRQVLSSQWCRCLETARLMNLGEVQPFPALNSFFGDRSRSTEQTNQIRQFLLENRDKPGVIVLVTHQVNITALSDIVPQSGAAIVLRINEDQIEILGQLQP